MHPSRSLRVGHEAALGHSGTMLLNLGGVSCFFLIIVITSEELAASFR